MTPPTLGRMQAKVAALQSRLQKAEGILRANPGLQAKIEGLLAKDAETAVDGGIIVSCTICNDDNVWDFPGGALLRCLYCGPPWMGGLGCLDLDECMGEGEVE